MVLSLTNCCLCIGGPCGVELAGEIEEVFRRANDADHKASNGEGNIGEHKVADRTVTIIQRNHRLNASFPVASSQTLFIRI
jgi:NADH dehydrogenase FAD-containing subunit